MVSDAGHLDTQHDRLLAWLRAREPAEPVAIDETHISLVAFQGDRVYKLKKNVRFPFVDLSTEELRREDCEREVLLNRRLAPDVYLGTETMIDGRGSPEPVVVMRRLPGTRRLSQLAHRPDDATVCVRALASLLGKFHAACATGGGIDDVATRDAVLARWRHEFAESAQWKGDILSDSTFARVSRLVERYVAGRAPLFDERIAQGRIRDGHGDLLADDVFCLPDGPRVLDCLEFSDLLRYGDVLADIAFLAMDLERLGHAELARQFLDEYRAVTHTDWPRSLEHFYIAYRAYVRAKVAAISGDPPRARQLLGLGVAHLDAGRVRFVLVGGPPATGKTTLARALGDTTGWPVLRSDEIRKQLGAAGADVDTRAPLDEGIYTPDWTARTYTTMCDRARHLLGRSVSVVADASWGDPQWRENAASIADETASDLVELCCRAPLEITAARAARRAAASTDLSDADARLTAELTARFPPWPAARTLDTTLAPDDAEALALEAIGPY